MLLIVKMDGPTTQKNIEAPGNANTLSIRDLLILKNFLEKGTRENLFLEAEKYSVMVLRTKIINIINEVYEKHSAGE